MLFSKMLFPPRCPFCSALIEPNKAACEKCFKYTQLAPHRQILTNGCICLSVFHHEGVWRKAVLDYKYHGNRQYYSPLAIILNNIISSRYSENHFDLYTSVPIHKDKLMERGFDHVKLLAKETARLGNQKYKPLLIQTSPNEFQHSLNGSERANNVKNIYSCTSSKTANGADILLFDDIVTTGATLCECSTILLNAGAKSVSCVTMNW